MNGNQWTEAELKILRKHYPKGGYKKVQALGLKRSKAVILTKASRLKIKCNNDGRFKLGVATTKGSKMSEATRKKVAHTFFKKGEPNHNLLMYDYAVSRWVNNKKNWSCWCVKLGKANWVPLHTWCWSEANGDPPHRGIVRISDYAAFEALVRSHGFTEKPPKKEPPGNWQRLIDFCKAVQPLLQLIERGEHMRRNSGSINLTDGYLANCIAWRDKALADEIKKQPILLEIKRQQLLNNRKIKSIQNG